MNNQYKHIVFGYGRSIEDELFNGSIPHYLLFLCLSYYYQDDYFDHGGNAIEISKDHKTATKLCGFHLVLNKAYGKLWINCNVKQIAEWTLRIDSISAGGDCNVMFMMKNNGSVTFNDLGIIKHAKSGDEYKVRLDTKEEIFNVSKIGASMIKEVKFNGAYSDCKLVLQLDAATLTITMTKFVLK